MPPFIRDTVSRYNQSNPFYLSQAEMDDFVEQSSQRLFQIYTRLRLGQVPTVGARSTLQLTL